MKKEAIIDIIINDLKEIELLLQNFKYGENIEGAFIDLLNSKHQNISKEIALLDFWRKDEKPMPQVGNVQSETTEKAIEEKPVPQPEAKVEKEELKPAAIEPQPEEKPIQVSKPFVEEKPEPVVEVAPIIEPKPTPTPVVEQKPIIEPKAEKHAEEPAKRSPKASDVKNYGTPVNDIKKAIAIADRFLFQKELFGGNADDFNSAIDTANSKSSYEEAEQYFLSTYGWDIENNTVVAFLKAVHRKFI